MFRNIADEELSHNCDTCNLRFLSRDILQYHMQRVHSVGNYHSDTRPVQSAVKSVVSSRLDCRLCYTIFVKQELLKAHEESVHKFEVEIHMEKHAFKCDGCVEVFDTKTKVLEHKKAMHGFKCGKCDESFEEYPLLGDHLRNYHSFRCKICSSFFDSAKTFGNHVKEEHFFKCDACEESFELSENLTSHQDEKHRSCETCEVKYKNPAKRRYVRSVSLFITILFLGCDKISFWGWLGCDKISSLVLVIRFRIQNFTKIR